MYQKFYYDFIYSEHLENGRFSWVLYRILWKDDGEEEVFMVYTLVVVMGENCLLCVEKLYLKFLLTQLKYLCFKEIKEFLFIFP